MDEKIELGLQIPQSVNNAPDITTVYPDDGEETAVIKCTSAISRELQRVLFKFFEQLNLKVREFDVAHEDCDEEAAVSFKERLREILVNLKSTYFSANAEIAEEEEGYIVEGMLEGPNLEQAKKLLASIEVIRQIEYVRGGVKFDIGKLTGVIAKSQEIVDNRPDDEHITANEQKKVSSAEATIADRTPKLEKNQTTLDEVTEILNGFLHTNTVEPDELWQSAQQIIEKFDKQGSLTPEAKKALLDVDRWSQDLKAACQVPKGERMVVAQPTPVEESKKTKIMSLVIKLCIGLFVLQGLVAMGLLTYRYAKKGNSQKPVPAQPADRGDGPINRYDVKALLAARDESIKAVINLRKGFQTTMKDPKVPKIPEHLKTKEEVKIYITKQLSEMTHRLLETPLVKTSFSHKQLAGDKPLMVFADTFKGKKLTAEVRALKYEETPTRDIDISTPTGEREGRKDYHLIDATRKITFVIIFKGAIKGSERISKVIKTKYIITVPRK
ncbi:hypothetical protein ACFL3T_01375 [Patescibacteria group bacterium]